MPLILLLETSSPVCSVAIEKDGALIGLKESDDQNHASSLTVSIDELFREKNLSFDQIDAVAVSAGPGSYTGLRIGASTAKGLCYTLSKPLIAVDSLQAFAFGMKQNHSLNDALYCPMIDARRMEIYYALFDNELNPVLASTNLILHEEFLATHSNKTIVVAGNGMKKSLPFISSQARIVEDVSSMLSAQWMISLSEKKFNLSQFENTETFEPNYVKPVFINAEKKDVFS